MQADSAAEVAARLNAKCHTWNILGGLPVYTPSDIAAAIGMMRFEVDRLFIRVIYAKQPQYQSSLEQELTKTLRPVLNQSVRFNQQTQASKLIRAVLTECLYQSLCLTCKGEGDRVLEKGHIAVCQDCSGTGYKPFSNYARANTMGIHREVMKRHYQSLYEDALNSVRRINDRAKSAFAFHLSEIA